MKLETFFEKFDLFADAPDAVARMRELTRTLAASGRLFSETDSKNCPVVRMKDVCAQITDGEHATPHRTSSGVPLATAKNVRDGFLNLTHTDYVAQTTAEKCWRRCKPQHDDILMVCVGATTGRVCLAQNPPDLVLVRSVALIRPKLERIAPAFLDLFLRSSLGQAQIWGNVKQSAQPCLYLGKMAEFEISLPPLAEQKRIVAKVDELMSLCDRLEEQQQEREQRHAALARASLTRFAAAPTVSNLKFLFHESYSIPPADLRKAILTLAVQGKLVPQDPNDEPAEKILVSIEKDRDAARREKRMRSFKVDEIVETLPFDLPTSWAWTQLAYLGAAEDGALCDGPFGSKLKTEHYIAEEGYAVVRLGNIGEGRFIRGKEGHISKAHYESLPSNHTSVGDLLIAGLADPLVRCCEIPPDLGPAVNKSDCFRMRVHPLVERSYVRHYLNSPIAKSFAAEENHGITRERINLAGAKALPIPCPPLAEQRRIVAKVEQLMALVDALETQLAAGRATAAKLLAALVAELTGTKSPAQAPKPAASGRRGRPRKA